MIVDVWADVVCPFTHVGLARLTQRRDTAGVDTWFRVHAWPLEWVNGKPLDPAFVAEEIAALRAQVAGDLFTGFDPATFPATSVPALALTAAAYARGPEVGERTALAVRHALFERGLDVSEPEVLAVVADELGIGDLAADEDAVRAEYDAGAARGVVGSPYFLVRDEGFFCPSLKIAHDEEGFVVAFDVDAFEDFARHAGL
jgi:predicted DsbA family dithiol-disulfide isomerase